MIKFNDLTKRLQNINFSKPIELTFRGKNYKYKSESEAVKELYKELAGEFSEYFIQEMIESGNYDINYWKEYYKYKDEKIDLTKEKHIEKIKCGKKHLLHTFLNSKHLTKQHDIYGKEFTFYDPLSNENFVLSLNQKEYEGICILVSIYNVVPRLFDYSLREIVESVKDLGKDKYDLLDDIVDYLNKKFPKLEFPRTTMLSAHFLSSNIELDNWINKLINVETPIVLTVNNYDYAKYLEQLDKNASGHAINIIGYDSFNYWIYDNAYNKETRKYKIEELLLKFLIRKINEDYKQYNNIKFLNKKYSKIGLKNCNTLVKEYRLADELKRLNYITHYQNIVKINKRLFKYVFDIINIVYLSENYNCSYIQNEIFDRHFIERIYDMDFSNIEHRIPNYRERYQLSLRNH